MTDQELLEKAAEAYGLVQADKPFFHGGLTEKVPSAAGYGVRGWNPLTDNGDALRLFVKCKLHIGMESHTVQAWAADDFGNFQTEILSHHGDEAATRRAIVRAAVATLRKRK